MGSDTHFMKHLICPPTNPQARKLSGRLFQEPSRRSTRLAAREANGCGSPSTSFSVDGNNGGGLSGPVSPSHHHCQNMPDPDHPPGAPTRQQTHISAKVWMCGAVWACAWLMRQQPHTSPKVWMYRAVWACTWLMMMRQTRISAKVGEGTHMHMHMHMHRDTWLQL